MRRDIRAIWSETEDATLRVAVCRYGCRWSAIVRSGVLPSRSRLALRLRWARVGSVAPCSREVVAFVECRQPSALQWLSLPIATLGMRGARSRACGRPWDHFICGNGGGRVLSRRRRQAVSSWTRRLRQPHVRRGQKITREKNPQHPPPHRYR